MDGLPGSFEACMMMFLTLHDVLGNLVTARYPALLAFRVTGLS